MKISRVFIFSILLLSSCTTVYRADPKKSAVVRSAITPAEGLAKKQKAGVDFYASGDSPAEWTLDMDLERDFRFHTEDEQNLIATVVSPVAGNNSLKYQAKTDAGLMQIIIYTDDCTDKNVNGRSSSKVEVTVSNKRYTGCGTYLYDERLNNIWTLEYLDNTAIEKSNSKKSPWLEFDLQKNKLYGNDGCRDISTDIAVQGNRVKIGSFAGSGKTCNNETGKIFSEMLSGKLVDYAIIDRQLFLYLVNDSKLIFGMKE